MVSSFECEFSCARLRCTVFILQKNFYFSDSMGIFESWLLSFIHKFISDIIIPLVNRRILCLLLIYGCLLWFSVDEVFYIKLIFLVEALTTASLIQY
jgi:hypothetical protein